MAEVADDVGAWERHLCAPFTGRKIICSFELLAAMTHLVGRFRRWGAERPLLIADGRGTGPVPTAEDAEILLVESPRFESLTEHVRARMRSAERLTPEVVAAVERYDPAEDAAWWVSPVGPNTPMLGRPVLGGRPPKQAALEDKLVIDDILDDLGASRPPVAVAAATYDDLMAATDRVRGVSGADQVVWSGDATQGVNGGGDYVRWIRSVDHAKDAADFFSRHCAQVRVSPFLEGVPCSIHAIVVPDGVVALRPMELASLRAAESGRFVYAGMGTSWDPPDADRDAMRELARRFGIHLQRTEGYRGAFCLDGVLTADGFRLTELNPRFSGGLSRLGRSSPDAHLELVHVNALLGRDLGRAAEQIEADALARVDDSRFVDVMGLSGTVTSTEDLEVAVAAGPGRLEVAQDAVSAIGTVACGPSPLGTFVRLTLSDEVVRVGDRVAPLSVLLLDFCDRMWDTGFGSVLMPPDVRR